MPRADDLAYFETEGACAYCGIRDSRVLTIHHLDATPPKDESYDNKIVLCHNCHQSHHQHKGPTTSQLLATKRRLITKTLTRIGLNALKHAYRRPAVVASPFLVSHLIEFGYLRHESDLSWCGDEDWAKDAEVVIDAVYVITPKGKALLEKWELK